MASEFSGKWLIGPNASKKIVLLAQSLHEKIRVKREGELSVKVAHYLPWLCAPTACRAMINLPLPTASLDLITEESFLRQFSAVFDGSKEQIFNLPSDDQDREPFYEITKFPDKIEVYNLGIEGFLSTQSWLKSILMGIVKCIMPIRAIGKERDSISFSSHYALGMIFLGIPQLPRECPDLQLTIDVAHELGHQVLMLYQHSDHLLLSPFDQRVYSGARMTERPAIMALHAAVALAYMISACLEIKRQAVNNQYQRHVNAVEETCIDELKKTLDGLSSLQFTRVGKVLFDELMRFSLSFAA